MNALAEALLALEKNPAHPPEAWNRGVRNIAQALAGGVANAVTFPGRYARGETGYTPGQMASEQPEATQWAPEMATNMVGAPALTGGVPGMGAGIRAYHGSPHDFDRFDMSKIGTGEGAQAYGHGLYFAENENVARQYRDALGGTATLDGTPTGQIALQGYGVGAKATPEQQIADYISSYGTLQTARYSMANRRPDLLPLFDELEKSGRLKAGGKMYEVNINAAPEQFLDWDKPLAQQPEHIRSVLDPIKGRLQSSGNPYVPAKLDSVGDVIQHGRAALRERGIEPSLREAGIPGIKYLDQGSRPKLWNSAQSARELDMAEQLLAEYRRMGNQNLIADAESKIAKLRADMSSPGTNNYVVFDDKLIDILKKYGLMAGALTGTGASLAPEQSQ
jgi:hypothetical protein